MKNMRAGICGTDIVEKLGGIPVGARETNVVEAALERFGGVTDIYGVERPDVDVYFDAAGVPGNYRDFATRAKRGAKLIALALSGNDVTFPQSTLVLSEIAMLGSMAYTADDVNEVIRYMAEGRYDPTPVISHTFAQEDAAEAFETAVEHKDLATKVIIEVHPGES